MMTARILIGAAAMILAACGPDPQRVVLKAPTADAPLAERLEAYDQLKPQLLQRTRHIVYRREPNSVDYRGDKIAEALTTDAIVLSDGQRVEAPRDLLPVVPPDSVVAHAIGAYEHHMASRASLYRWTLAGLAGTMLAVVATTAYAENNTGPMVIFGLGGVASGGLGMLGWYHGALAERSRAAAYRGYGRALRQRLDLCEVDGELGPCDAIEQAPARRAPPANPLVRF